MRAVVLLHPSTGATFDEVHALTPAETNARIAALDTAIRKLREQAADADETTTSDGALLSL